MIARGVKICVPVKADAYGHGAVMCARAALQSGADCLGVATTDEGRELRAAGITPPVLLFTLPARDEIAQCVHDNLEPLVYDETTIALFETHAASLGKQARLHLKIDTGMGRAGCSADEAVELAKQIARSEHLTLAGT